ncbi:MAG: YARHG domain-containing protein [Bacteroidetes bacterium]|nr:YARHG domain-containing protein [Bacteroidota bacterium]
MKKMIFILLIFFSENLSAQTLKDCANCSTQIIRPEQIKDLSIDEIRFLTNDLFARKGYRFSSGDVDAYYAETDWYKPVADNTKIIFNNIEKQNIKLFQEKTSEIKEDRKKLMQEIKNFKTAVLANDKQGLITKYTYAVINKDYKEQFTYLTNALTKINIDDVNWSLNVGIYKITVDNGDYIMSYELNVTPQSFVIKYNHQGGSEIGKQLYPNDPTTEFAYWWEFKWENNKITFVKMEMAG